jgi:hypothetical protein
MNVLEAQERVCGSIYSQVANFPGFPIDDAPLLGNCEAPAGRTPVLCPRNVGAAEELRHAPARTRGDGARLLCHQRATNLGKSCDLLVVRATVVRSRSNS